MTQADPSVERLLAQSERLLVQARRLAEENAQLRQALNDASVREESLRKRLGAARARVDALISRLPAPEPGGETPSLLTGAQ